ncbi:MAG: AEC family transporter [Propionibacteriaceae bacterium]|nr:AEC family transporter [Propionibacteriaceae bacterium]
MLDILVITAPLYLCILAGWAATRFGLFRRSDMDVIGSFVMNVALPALMFLSMAQRPLTQVANPTYLLAYAITSPVVLVSAYLWSRRVNRTPRAAAAFDALGSGGANSGFVGFPLLLVVMPSVAGVVFGMNVIVESLITVPLCLFWAERSADASGLFASLRRSVGSMLRMPIFIALMAGVVVSAVGLPLPAVLVTSFDLLGRASTGAALFAVGGLLVGLSIKGNVRRLAAVTVAKLAVMPAVAWASATGLVLLGMPALEGELFAAIVLSGAMPAWTSSVVFAARYGERDVPPAVLLVTTMVSFGTLSGLLVVLT